jgi:hypothetical protein
VSSARTVSTFFSRKQQIAGRFAPPFRKLSQAFRRKLAGGTTDLPLRRYLD